MFDPRIGATLRRAARLFGRPGPETTDAALLDRLTRDRDPAAFSELLTRHGPAVWSLCRRLTRREPDAEDVFQATFLVLARDAARVRKAASVGSWLYGVAFRLARKARSREDRTPDPARLRAPVPPDPTTELSWNEVRSALDEELARLPDVLRAPLLLCYFDGMTQDEVANELHWNARTVKDRIARGRALLRVRLSRRGIELPAALSVPLLSAGFVSAAPAQLHNRLLSVAPALARGRPPGPDVSPAVVALARTEVPAMSVLRLTLLVASAAGLLVAGSLIGRPLDPAPQAAANDAQPPAPQPDPTLPPGAVRIGTTQFRPEAGWHSRAFFLDGGKSLVTVGEGPVIRYWDVETGKSLHQFKLEGIYNDATFTPSNNLLAVVGVHWPKGEDADSEGVLWLIDAPTRKVLRTVNLPGNSGGNSQKVAISADGKRVFVEYEGDVRVIDAKSGEELMRHKGRINAGAMAASADGKLIAFGRYELWLWAWETGEEPKKFATLGSFGTETITFSPDAKTLYVSDHGSKVKVFDVATGRQTGTFDVGGTPWKWSFSPDGKTLAITYHSSRKEDGFTYAVVLWDAVTGKQTGRLPVGRTTATSPSWSADGSRLVTTTDYRIFAWDVKTAKLLGPNEPSHEGLIGVLAFSADGRLFTASDDNTIRSWDPATGKAGLELVHDYWVRGMAVSPDGSLVAGSALGNDLRIWDTKTGAERFRLLGNGDLGGKRKVRFTPDGKRLIAWGDDLYLRVWDTRNGKLLAEHRTLPEGVTEAQFEDERSREFLIISLSAAGISPDGSAFAFGMSEKVRVFDVETGKVRMTFEADPNGVTALTFSPDGKRIAIAGRAGSIETRLPNGRIRSTSTGEHQVAVWDLATKQPVWKAKAPGWMPAEIGFSPDGSRLAETAYSSGKAPEKANAVRLWDAATGQDIGRVELPHSGGHFAFDRTGKRLAVSHRDTTAVVYDLETALKPNTPK